MERIDFARKYSLGKFSLNYYISSKVFFSVAEYLKRSNKTPTSIQICIGLVDVVPKILGSRLCILTSVLIAIDYFFRCQRSTVNLENKKYICQGMFFCLPLITGSTYSRIIFRTMNISSTYIKNVWKEVVQEKIQFVPELTILLNL